MPERKQQVKLTEQSEAEAKVEEPVGRLAEAAIGNATVPRIA